MLLTAAGNILEAQDLTLSDIQKSGCQRGSQRRANGEAEETRTIILQKEGDILSVQLQGFVSNCATEGFDVTPGISGGTGGKPYSVTLDVEAIVPDLASICECPFNVSFTLHGLEANNFRFSCWWYDGQVSLTEGEPLTLESVTEHVTIDDWYCIIDKVNYTAVIEGTNGEVKDLFIPDKLYHGGQLYSVTRIKEWAFFNSKSLTSITLPPTITRICEKAFAYCSSLKDVYCYFEDDLPAVEASVFANTPIASATLHVPAASINMYKATSPWNKFGSIKGTGSVTIDGLNYYLFTGGNEAALYKGNEWTGELDIPSEVKFQEQTYTITGTTRGAFADCPELTKVRIPKTLAKIWDSYTFFYNPYEEVPTGLINPIYMNIFTECTALESIEVEEGNPGLKSVDGVLFSQDGIGQYYYRTNKYYGTGLYCYPMGKQQKTYAIPEGVEWIGGAAFYDNQYLASLTIPRSMKHICFNAFSGCSNLMDVYCEAEDVPIAWDVVFNDIPNSATLHVPAGSIDKYKATSPWSHFGNIVALNDPVTFTAGQMATIVLPTEPDASKGKYYGLAGCEGNEIVFGQELHPQAHVPYIIVPYEDFSIDPAELDLAGLTGDTVSVDGISFIGAYRQTELKVQKGYEYVFIDTTPDCQYGDSVREVVGALRAYLTVNWDDPIDHGGARSPLQKMEIVLRDHGTGLETAGHSPQNDLSGRQVRTMRPGHQPGIYIVDGKKTAY